MLYIKKNTTPKKIQERVIQIEKSDEWKSIKDDDTKGIRACFDSLSDFMLIHISAYT